MHVSHAHCPPPPTFTFLQVKGHQAGLHANKGGKKIGPRGCHNPGILQIPKFIIVLLIMDVKITVLSQSPDSFAVKSAKTGEFDLNHTRTRLKGPLSKVKSAVEIDYSIDY